MSSWEVVRKEVAGQIVYSPCRGSGKQAETLGLFLTPEDAGKVIRIHEAREAAKAQAGKLQEEK